MAKRVRGSGSGHRPGGLGPTRSRRAGGDERPGDDVYMASADIDSAIDAVQDDYVELAMEEDAPVARKTRRVRRSARSDELSARIAAENVYVRDDLRRIGVVSLVLLVSLAVAWVLFVAMDLLGLY